jgi:GDP-4-dehydro-6-deoxy-D-mannose reductase
MRILLTGVTGFAGGHLAEALLRLEYHELFAISRGGKWPPEWQHLAGRVDLRACDLTEAEPLRAALRTIRPDEVYHLAGYASTGRSFQEVEAAWEGNLTATRRLYEAVCGWGGRPRILYVGSGLIYGDAERPDQAQDERCPIRPASPYAASKAAADLASYQYTRSPGLEIVRVRPFNHIGPRQSPRFALAHFAQQIAAIERGQAPPVLKTGNLSPLRDLTDVRDMVQAYILLMRHGQAGEAYNAGSGMAHAMQAVLDRLLAQTDIPIEVQPQNELRRGTETAAMLCDARKLRRQTGWLPRYALDQTLADILSYWRQQG